MYHRLPFRLGLAIAICCCLLPLGTVALPPTARVAPSRALAAYRPAALLWEQEAEAGTLSGGMASRASTEASGGAYVASASHSSGAASYTFSLPRAGSYYLWARARAWDWNSDSFTVALDALTPLIWQIPQVQGQWAWDWFIVNDGAHIGQAIALGAGQHTLIIRGREPEAALDKLALTDSLPSPEDQPGPANDLRAGATIVSDLPTTLIQSITNATNSSDDPSFGIDQVLGDLGAGAHTVWFRYRPAQDGILQASTAASSCDTLVQILWDAPGGLARMGHGYHQAGYGSGSASAPVTAGQDYYIEVDLSQAEASLNLRMAWIIPEELPSGWVESSSREHWYRLGDPADCHALALSAWAPQELGEFETALDLRVYDQSARTWLLDEAAVSGLDCTLYTAQGHSLLIHLRADRLGVSGLWRHSLAYGTTALFSDTFALDEVTLALDPRWQRVDPLGGSQFLPGSTALDPYDQALDLVVPAGARVFDAHNQNAPRLLQPTCEERFGAQTTFTLWSPTLGQSAGLLLWADGRNWLRVGLNHDGMLHIVYAVGGAWSDGWLGTLGTQRATLRLERDGDTVRLYAANGESPPALRYTLSWPQRAAVPGHAPLLVGLYAANAHPTEQTGATFAEFLAIELSASPAPAFVPLVWR
jgi:regulation of enolase protein 1 (concanavalin A-like superfamily)